MVKAVGFLSCLSYFWLVVEIYNVRGNALIGSALLNVLTPEMFGAVGDGITNDKSAIQNAVLHGGFVLFSAGKKYITNDVIRLVGNTIIDLNGSELSCTNKHLFFNFLGNDVFTQYNGNGNIIIRNGILSGGAISFGHAENVLLENIILGKPSDKADARRMLAMLSGKSHQVKTAVAVRYLDKTLLQVVTTEVHFRILINIDPCYRGPFPWLDNASSVFYDGTVNNGIYIDNCRFSIGDGDYAYGYNAIGVHASDGAKHQNIRITNNEVLGFTGCGLRINNMNSVLIGNNTIKLTANGSNGIRIGDVVQSTNVLIKGNAIISSGTAVTKANNSTVFQSADNDINPTFS